MNILDAHPWQHLSGVPVKDIRQYIKDHASDKFTVHIGTDTKPSSSHTTLITTICFREESRGALVVYQKSKIGVFPTVRDRLFHETYVSLEVAEAVTPFVGHAPTIHADVNPKQDSLSSQVMDSVVGMIKGMGYPVIIKPEAWAADIADMYTR